MARLVVKRTPCWVVHRKWLVVWLPLAGLQAATLAGLGYFYHRLDNLEKPAERGGVVVPVVGAVTPVASVPEPVVTTVVPPVPITEPPAPLPPIAANHDVPEVHYVFLPAAEPPATAKVMEKTPVAASPKKPAGDVPPSKQERKPELKPVAQKPKAQSVGTAGTAADDLTATANRAALPERLAVNKAPRQEIEPLPTQVERVWVYLGELRDYGWYDQKLHIHPSSGLPEEGHVYTTQFIPNVYSAPYGRQMAGQFHLGERVFIHEVRRGKGDDVWGLVSAQ